MRGRVWRPRIDARSHPATTALRIVWMPWQKRTSLRQKMIAMEAKINLHVSTPRSGGSLHYFALVDGNRGTVSNECRSGWLIQCLSEFFAVESCNVCIEFEIDRVPNFPS